MVRTNASQFTTYVSQVHSTTNALLPTGIAANVKVIWEFIGSLKSLLPVIATIISANGTTLRVVSKNICHDATLGCLQIPPPAEVYLDTTPIRLSCMATLYYIELIHHQ